MLNIVLKHVMKERSLSSHQVAEAVGVSHTTILRAVRGDKTDLKTVISIANWLAMRPSELLNSLGDKKTLGDKLATVLGLYPDLEDVFRRAIKAVEDGSADPAIIADIVQYATYKLNAVDTVGKSKSRHA